MLAALFPLTHTRYTSLPLLGGVLEPLCSWLRVRGYPPDAIVRRIEAAPLLDKRLLERQIQTLSSCTAAALRACFPQRRRGTPLSAYALGRSLLQDPGRAGRLGAHTADTIGLAHSRLLGTSGPGPGTCRVHHPAAHAARDRLAALPPVWRRPRASVTPPGRRARGVRHRHRHPCGTHHDAEGHRDPAILPEVPRCRWRSSGGVGSPPGLPAVPPRGTARPRPAVERRALPASRASRRTRVPRRAPLNRIRTAGPGGTVDPVGQL